MNDPFSILLCLPEGTELFDPDPEQTARRDVDLVDEWRDDTRGVVGWSDGGGRALEVAAAHPELERLVLVSLPFPDDGLPERIDAITAKTLLLFGSADPRTGSSHGTRWQAALPDARLEMCPGLDHDVLVPMWKRVVSFLAPRRKAA